MEYGSFVRLFCWQIVDITIHSNCASLLAPSHAFKTAATVYTNREELIAQIKVRKNYLCIGLDTDIIETFYFGDSWLKHSSL